MIRVICYLVGFEFLYRLGVVLKVESSVMI